MTTGAKQRDQLAGAERQIQIKNSTPSQLVTALQREHADWVTEIIEALGEVTAIVPALTHRRRVLRS